MNFYGHKGSITSLSISYDSTYFISGSVDANMMLWNLKIGHCLAIFKGHLKTVWTVKMSPRGHYFASGGADSMVFLWSTNQGAPLMSFTEHTDDVVQVDFCDNLSYVVTASNDKTLRIWNIENNQQVRVLFFPDAITRFKFNRNADFLIAGTRSG